MEHVRSRKKRLSVLVQFDVRSEDISVSSEDLFRIRIPDDELLVWVFHCVELVDIHRESASTT